MTPALKAMEDAERELFQQQWLAREGLTEAPIRVAITESISGETRTYDDLGVFEAGAFQDFIWAEGNYSCDCNRAMFFAEAGGEPDPDRDCGDDGFSVKITDAAGVVLYEDDE